MASFNRVTFSGSTDTISVPFGYLDKSHVVVSLDGVELASGAYSWPSNGQVKITAGNPAAGVVGEVRRVTPATPIVNFEPGNLDTDDLDTASLQAIYIAEEAKDDTSDIVNRAWYTSNFQPGGEITKGSLDVVPKYNASGNLVPGPSAADIAAAQGYAASAGSFAVDAGLAAGASAGSASAASGSAALAQDWANKAVDTPVAGGLFSAFHWAQKAYEVVTAGIIDLSVTTAKLANGAVTQAKLASSFVSGWSSKGTLVDADTFLIGDSAASGVAKVSSLANTISSIFNGTRAIANGVFLAASYAWQNAGGFRRTHDISGHTANRATTWPDGPVTIPAGTLITAADVPLATADLAAGAVGTYAQMFNTSNSVFDVGTTRAGSGLRFSSGNADTSSTVPSGTWRCMGYSFTGTASPRVTLWMRIS